MGLVTNVYWNCPGCGSLETAQVFGQWGDPSEFPKTAVPADRELKWNPPCEGCGKFKLVTPHTTVACLVVPVEKGNG
jgi:hypothetical protein